MNAFLGGNSEQSLDGTLLVLTSPPTRTSVRVPSRLFFGRDKMNYYPFHVVESFIKLREHFEAAGF